MAVSKNHEYFNKDLAMSMKIFATLIVTVLISGCMSHKYSIVESEYSYDKTNSGGQKYVSKTPFLVNHRTGETFKMTYDKDNGYHWQAVRYLNVDDKSE